MKSVILLLLMTAFPAYSAQRIDTSLAECLSIEDSFKDRRNYDYRLGSNRKEEQIFTINCKGPKFYVLIENIAEFRQRTGYAEEHWLDSPAARQRVDDLLKKSMIIPISSR